MISFAFRREKRAAIEIEFGIGSVAVHAGATAELRDEPGTGPNTDSPWVDGGGEQVRAVAKTMSAQ